MLKKLLFASAIVSVSAISAPSFAADAPTIPIIVKDTTSFYWQIVLAGARAGRQGSRRQRSRTRRAVGIRHQRRDFDPRKRGRREARRGRHRADRIQGARQADRRSRQESADHRHRFRGRFQGLHLVPDHRQRPGRTHRRRRPGRRRSTRNTARPKATSRSSPHLPGVGSLEARNKGFKEELAAKYPGLKLVADKVADGNATTGLNIMTDLITANPNLRGVFAAI